TINFDTLNFQLYERSAYQYHWNFPFDYIIGQLLTAGPLIGWLLIWAAFRSTTNSPLQKALKFTLAGIYLFFLVQSFYRQTEPNWTTVALIPLIVLSHEWLDQRSKLKNWVYKSLPFTLLIVVGIRIIMVNEIHYFGLDIKSEFYGNKTDA